jgi:hypothetical protein
MDIIILYILFYYVKDNKGDNPLDNPIYNVG